MKRIKIKENINVELVKYDMDKTKKRKRSHFKVSEKTEKSVINKLERIHKGEKLLKIIELKWGPQEDNDSNESQRYSGKVKFYEESKGFGFISPDEDMDDLFFHATSLGDVIVNDGDSVSFEVSEGPKGLVALHISVDN